MGYAETATCMNEYLKLQSRKASVPKFREVKKLMMMEGKKNRRGLTAPAVFLLYLFSTFSLCFPADIRPVGSANRYRSSAVFPIKGNVYPLGYYSVSLNIGWPPKVFELDIDSGSDLTWVQCDAPCSGCTKPNDELYKPKNNVVRYVEPLCKSLHSSVDNSSINPDEQCDYEIEYADHGSSLGVLVNDSFPMKFSRGSVFSPSLVFGCGYDQKYSGPHPPPPTAGVLGLGHGRISLVSQLHGQGLVRNVVGHCLSTKGGGFLFFGDDLVPSSGVVWTQMSTKSAGKHFSSGPAEVYFGGKSLGTKGLTFIFDSGSSYTYFTSKLYKTVLNLMKNDLKGKPLKEAPEDKSLPICWKGDKPFKSVHDVANYFKPLAVIFTNSKTSQTVLSLESYLVITKYGNACFGILNGSEVGLGDFNIIGDISLQDKLVIYDNEKRRIGWAPSNCNRLPNQDRDYDGNFPQLYAPYFDVLREHHPHLAFQVHDDL